MFPYQNLPLGIVLVMFSLVQEEEDSLNEVGYDDIGGCRRQLAQIKEVCHALRKLHMRLTLCCTCYPAI